MFPLPRNLLFATVHVSSRFQFLICPSRSFSFFFFPFVQLLVFLPNFKRWSLSFYLFFFYFVGAESFSVSFPFKIDKMATFGGFCSFLLLLNLCVSASCSFSFVGLSCFPFWNWQDRNLFGFLSSSLFLLNLCFWASSQAFTFRPLSLLANITRSPSSLLLALWIWKLWLNGKVFMTHRILVAQGKLLEA